MTVNITTFSGMILSKMTLFRMTHGRIRLNKTVSRMTSSI